MDYLAAKNREALYMWYVRRNAWRKGQVQFESPWPRLHMAVLDREYLEKRLAARRWLAENTSHWLKHLSDNVIDFNAFNRRRRGY